MSLSAAALDHVRNRGRILVHASLSSMGRQIRTHQVLGVKPLPWGAVWKDGTAPISNQYNGVHTTGANI